MISIAVCDDCNEEREDLKSMLFSIQNNELEWEFRLALYESGEALLYDLEEEKACFDLIFLDIYMNGIDGMQTAKKIRKNYKDIPLVFLTCSADFAVESYDVDATGYLLKPVSEEKLKTVLNKVFSSRVRKRICIQSQRQKKYLYLDEIMYIESRGHNLYIHTSDQSVFPCREKLNSFEAILDECFLRCHQSFFVNMDYIADVKEDFVLTNGVKIPIRVRQHKQITETYYRFFVKNRS